MADTIPNIHKEVFICLFKHFNVFTISNFLNWRTSQPLCKMNHFLCRSFTIEMEFTFSISKAIKYNNNYLYINYNKTVLLLIRIVILDKFNTYNIIVGYPDNPNSETTRLYLVQSIFPTLISEWCSA